MTTTKEHFPADEVADDTATNLAEQEPLVEEGQEELFVEAEGKDLSEVLSTLHESSLNSLITNKYLSLGRQMLSDEVPRRLSSDVQRRLEGVLGFSLDHIRIHTGEKARSAAEMLGARAFAVGERDIYFAQEEYQPDTVAGQALLVHEITHTQETAQAMAPATREGPTGESEQSAVAKEEEYMELAEEDEDPVAGGSPLDSPPSIGEEEDYCGMTKDEFLEYVLGYYFSKSAKERNRTG